MPGIVGLITKRPRDWAEPQLTRMVAALRHEPFYVTGTSIEESLGVYVGWVAREGSFSAKMPVHNEYDNVVLVFSGEDYPEPESIYKLRNRGHEFEREGPSYLVHQYEEDPSFPKNLNGPFQALLVDRRNGSAKLFNDRYGMRRLCYYQSNEAFYFAAEAKAILAVRPELRVPDPRSLGEFVSCSCVLGDRTLFKDIQVLPGGSAWIFRNGSIEQKNNYFHPHEWESQESLDPESYYRELRDVLSRNLSRYFAGPEPLGLALTGGMDTRMIMAWHKLLPGALPCYTYGGPFRECEDVSLARRIATLCHQPHEVITVGDEFLSRFSHYAERSIHITEGGLDVYRASDLYASEKARKIAPAKIVGTYGSEIVRQAVMFKATPPPPDLFRPEFLTVVHQAEDRYSELRREHPITFAAFRQSPWYHQGVLALEGTQLTVRSPYLDTDFVRTVFRTPKSSGPNGDIRFRLIREGSPELGKIPTDRGIGGDSGPLLSLVGRVLQEFTFRAEYAYDYGMPQWLSRFDHLCAPLRFERLFLGRHKLTHFRVWYRDVLSKYVREMLLDSRTLSRPYLNRKAVEAIVNGHTRGGLNYTTAIHKLLSLELLQRLFFDSR